MDYILWTARPAVFFETLPVFHITGASDGCSLQIDDILPEPVDMGESGEIVLRDISQRSIFGKGMGKALRSVWSVQSPLQGPVIGVHFDFGEPVKPLVLDWSDELYVAEHYPDDAGDDELQEIPIMPA